MGEHSVLYIAFIPRQETGVTSSYISKDMKLLFEKFINVLYQCNTGVYLVDHCAFARMEVSGIVHMSHYSFTIRYMYGAGVLVMVMLFFHSKMEGSTCSHYAC